MSSPTKDAPISKPDGTKVKPGIFHPAKLWHFINWLFQSYIYFDLLINNRLIIDRDNIKLLKEFPRRHGLILTPNHADETDFKVCVEIARRAGRNFIYMLNAEAFDEGHGMAGWWMQRLGAFSVDRGGLNALAQSKDYALKVVTGQDVLVIFPEGEIYYLNDQVQPLKSGVVEIALRAILQERQAGHENWSVYLMPMAIKYSYPKSIQKVLDKRIRKIEKHLHRKVRSQDIKLRLALIFAELLRRQEMAHNLEAGSASLQALSGRVADVRQAVLKQVEARYEEISPDERKGLLDRSWKLSSYLRSLPRGSKKETLAEMKKDLASLARVARMVSWQPQYVELNPSQERLAETVLKLERDVYNIKRPRQLAKRRAHVKIGSPIDLSPYMDEYERAPHEARHLIADKLRAHLQGLIDAMASNIEKNRAL
ncbi:MAG: 1-acyl-sn-glycerol-3-phosphate acyltransferase [Candidatus Obscuribacter sp.]|nr:1-acyl-sn-glycerol-3-phosphate acyltransferase [Candidatus Obscuribacter sp.]MBK9278506.1 1-acyl-sn-glycerol-3-phosphate acyltransferase [Candidatus Obscuribacter sp.]MBL8082512.1 1-acyl-sn-glycerol-3-phosphate acyltransferase [Candidatus Obscuribacter sp.]